MLEQLVSCDHTAAGDELKRCAGRKAVEACALSCEPLAL
jgi:hypothetical protein